MSDDYTQRDLDGTYANNETDASFVIDCLDWQGAKSTTEISSSSKLFAKEAPVFGPYLAYAGLSCQFFPALSTIRQPIKLIKTTPIVIIGTTRDPATPYVWAQALHKAIANSSLISLNGDGHTGYGHGSTCVDSAVDAYFLYGKVPKKELLCTTSFNE
ncbi:MAG: alpha/beta hydrolase [Actinomycetota bacterium]